MGESGIREAPERWSDGVRKSVRQIGPVRLTATILILALGLIVARHGWTIPLISDAERAFYDHRFVRMADRTLEQDERILLVVFDDQTLEQLGKRSPLDRQMLARALRAIDRMGPRAIGIDILIDQRQPEDPELIATFRQMRTPTFLAFASSDREYGNPDQMEYWQEQFLRGFLAQVRPGPVRPASIRIEPDLADGVIRRWGGRDPRLPPLLANALSPVHPEFENYRGSVDFRPSGSREIGRFTTLAIQLFAGLEDGSLEPEARAGVEAVFAETVRGRYVLIGGDIKDLDDYETPMTRFGEGWMKGLELHAHMLAQQLDGRMRSPVPGWLLWLAAILIVTAGAMTGLFEGRRWKLVLILAAQIAAIVAIPLLLQRQGVETLDLPAFGWGLGWLLAFVGAGTAARAIGAEQRAFAQSALGKYLPRDVARQIIRDPDRLALKGEKTEIFALFTDLEGFTKLSHAITPERLSSLLNPYLDRMSEIVLDHGGTIDKFVGDAVVAFWGAPIPRADDGARAARAAIAMYEAGEEFRRTAGDDIPPIGCTRVGLHCGEAVVGNFGGEDRIQYTALGDAMNTAARLESANKALKTTILVSNAAKTESGLDCFRPMGRIVLSGRSTPCEVWEPVPHMDPALRRELNDLWRFYEAGDSKVISQLEGLAARHAEDLALAQFVQRIRSAGPGGHYVLDSK